MDINRLKHNLHDVFGHYFMANFDYDGYRLKSVTDKINQEIVFFDNPDYQKLLIVAPYLSYLKNRIGADKVERTTMIQYDNSGNKQEIKKMNLNDYQKDMDIYVFKKPWARLKEFHKTMKIKEYVETLDYHKKKCSQDKIDDNRKYLIDELCDGLKNKKFFKNKNVIIYDEEKMIITAISSVNVDKKTGLYQVSW